MAAFAALHLLIFGISFSLEATYAQSERNPQIYRVVGTAGGRLVLSGDRETRASRTRADTEAKSSTTLTISCFYYGFNGNQLGPIQQIFEVKKYDGLKGVMSLPVYPINSGILPHEKMREVFMQRGEKFVELTKNRSAVVHKRYEGLALDLNHLPEEVRGALF